MFENGPHEKLQSPLIINDESAPEASFWFCGHCHGALSLPSCPEHIQTVGTPGFLLLTLSIAAAQGMKRSQYTQDSSCPDISVTSETPNMGPFRGLLAPRAPSPKEKLLPASIKD